MMNNTVSQIVEVIGPAGAGKTSLCQALSHCSQSIQLSNFPDVRQISALPFLARNGFQISPALLSFPQHNSRKLTRREFAWLLILNGWAGILQEELKKTNKVIVLDQGPIYLLTEIHEFGPEFLRAQNTESFWRDLYFQWANTLDMVVWLDAENTDLIKRIRSRNKGHPVKDESIETTFEFLICYRKAYEQIISNLLRNQPSLKVLRFDTSRTPMERIACQILLETGLT